MHLATKYYFFGYDKLVQMTCIEVSLLTELLQVLRPYIGLYYEKKFNRILVARIPDSQHVGLLQL